MKPQKLKVTAPNRFIRVRGVPSRTPFETIIKNEQELEFMKNYLHSLGISDFSIEPVEEEKEVKATPAKRKTKSSTKKKEEIKKPAVTILEKIADEVDLDVVETTE